MNATNIALGEKCGGVKELGKRKQREREEERGRETQSYRPYPFCCVATLVQKESGVIGG